MAAKKISKTSSSSSSTAPVNKPRRDAKWRAMMMRRNAIMKRGTCLEILKEAAAGCSLETSHGVTWARCCLLGKGGYGSVFLAKRKTTTTTTSDGDLPDKIAVKSATLENASTLKHEKRVLCDLKASPNVIRCYGDEITDTGCDGEKIYNLLLEFCCGLSLHRQIKLSGSGLPESDVRKYTRDVVKGLKYVHCRGYIHCDVKPGNILLVPGTEERSGGFVAKIADFGLAMSIYENQNWGDDLIGTYPYMSPELVKEKRYDYGVDIWALGCAVVEMLSGKPVWPRMDVPGKTFTWVAKQLVNVTWSLVPLYNRLFSPMLYKGVSSENLQDHRLTDGTRHLFTTFTVLQTFSLILHNMPETLDNFMVKGSNMPI
ncbi:hypothetical protein D5086_013274 [Populus alba]|uniref:Uncharacterized protein n=1 Tax=Populus alba TaxID=43335 RepID=A0ACC4C5S6_POPAL